MDKELLEQFQMLAKGMEQMEERLNEKMTAMETRINIKIENEVTKRIDGLFDGYKLTHEKQWELERRVERVEQVIAELQNKIA